MHRREIIIILAPRRVFCGVCIFYLYSTPQWFYCFLVVYADGNNRYYCATSIPMYNLYTVYQFFFGNIFLYRNHHHQKAFRNTCTGIFNNYWKIRGIRNYGTGENGGLGPRLWVFPKRNGKIIGWLVGIPRSDCKIPLTAGWVHSWVVVWWTGGLVAGGAYEKYGLTPNMMALYEWASTPTPSLTSPMLRPSWRGGQQPPPGAATVARTRVLWGGGVGRAAKG